MSLEKKHIACLVADLTHDEELNFPRYWLTWKGAKVLLAGLSAEHKSKLGQPLKPDLLISQLEPAKFDAVVIPGGFGPDKLRVNEATLKFVREMDASQKVIAAICHGAQVLISAGIVKGRKLTCVKNVAIDVVNAGGIFEDKPVVVDGNLVTSRLPPDLPAFTDAIAQLLVARPFQVAKA